MSFNKMKYSLFSQSGHRIDRDKPCQHSHKRVSTMMSTVHRALHCGRTTQQGCALRLSHHQALPVRGPLASWHMSQWISPLRIIAYQLGVFLFIGTINLISIYKAGCNTSYIFHQWNIVTFFIRPVLANVELLSDCVPLHCTNCL